MLITYDVRAFPLRRFIRAISLGEYLVIKCFLKSWIHILSIIHSICSKVKSCCIPQDFDSSCWYQWFVDASFAFLLSVYCCYCIPLLTGSSMCTVYRYIDTAYDMYIVCLCFDILMIYVYIYIHSYVRFLLYY